MWLNANRAVSYEQQIFGLNFSQKYSRMKHDLYLIREY